MEGDALQVYRLPNNPAKEKQMPYKYLTASYVDSLGLETMYMRYGSETHAGWGPRRSLIHGFVTYNDSIYEREEDGLAYARNDRWSPDGRGGFVSMGF